ncbi:UDP-N-acetylmuramate--L-alanine ligase [Myroides sp. LJL119]
MLIDKIKSVYFIGVGGIGMSALARYFKYIGKQVMGYDRAQTQLTRELEKEGIPIVYQSEQQSIGKDFLDPSSTLVVVTPAIKESHEQWAYFLQNNFTIKKRSEVLGIITKDTYCFAVAGTHGKTTTTSILGHLLYEAGLDVTAFVGGVVENYQSNLIGRGKTITVVEADEFDRSFLRLHPNTACITSTEADHLDIFGDAQTMYQAFENFADLVEDKENLFVSQSVSLQGIKVGFDDSCTYQIKDVSVKDNWYEFCIVTPNELIENVRFGLPGRHNLSNALIAFAMANKYGVSSKALVKSLASFQGVRRRFSYVLRRDDLIYIDDYAHHPTEIAAVSQAVHEMFEGKKILAVFQPHLYSRTRDFMQEFAEALSLFDNVALLDIYPARELPINGVSSSELLKLIKSDNKVLVAKDELIDFLKHSDAQVILTIGAGDIGEMVNLIKEELK